MSSTIVISPVLALIPKIPSPFPETIVQFCSEPPLSTSVAATVPTRVPVPELSGVEKPCPGVITGALSLVGVMEIENTCPVVVFPTPSSTSKTKLSLVVSESSCT